MANTDPLYKEDKDFVWRYVSRPIAVFISKHFLFHIPVSANQLTIFGTLLTIFASYIISLGGYTYPIIGCLILQACLVIDCADGTVARYRKTTGIFGMYAEEISHNIAPYFLMLGLGINSFKAFNDYRILILLSFTVIFMHIIAASRFSKDVLLIYLGISPEKKIAPKIVRNSANSMISRFVFPLIELVSSPAKQQTLLLIVALFGYLHYAILFFFLFYLVVAVFKVVIEYRSGFKIFGLER